MLTLVLKNVCHVCNYARKVNMLLGLSISLVLYCLTAASASYTGLNYQCEFGYCTEKWDGNGEADAMHRSTKVVE